MNETTATRPVPAGTAVRRALTVLAAAAAALLVWVIADPIAGAGMHARGQHVGPAAVLVSTLLIGLAGWGLLAVMERRAKRPGRTWGITAGIALGLSMTGPMDSEGAGTYAALTAMHLVVGAVLIAGLGRTAARGRC
ncbi:DUF6069 family protein [Actinomadura sp. NTSP31]|uniref:DUF6069 family protein n=1 Tax=Actinomadura sp. NTSP31 TaxID=1735447 RepID=UPI0035C032BA